MAVKVKSKDSAREAHQEERLRVPIFEVFILRDGQRFMAKCPKLDLVTEEDTKEDAFQSLVEIMKEYTEDYLNRLDVFLASSNRAHQYPYILEIKRCKDDWELLQLLEVK